MQRVDYGWLYESFLRYEERRKARMKPYYQVLRDALNMYAHKDGYAYLYGANGQVADAALVDRLMGLWPDHFKGIDRARLVAHVSGKKAYDCSAFVNFVTVAAGVGDKYPSADRNASMLIEQCKVRTTPAAGVAGSVLYKKGHIALDIGYGACVEFAGEFTDMRIRRIGEAGFEVSGRLPWVDYTGAQSV